MNYQIYADKKFRQMTEEAPANNCSVLIHERGVLIDAGCDCPGGWMVAKCALEGLTGGRGQVSFAQRQMEDAQRPAVELFLDDPVGAAASFARDENGVFGVAGESGYALGVSLEGAAAARQAVGNLVAAAPGSLFADVLEMGSLIAKAVEALHAAGIRDIQWAWSSCPLSVLTDDPVEAHRRRAETAAHFGAVSVWVRGGEKEIRTATEGFQGAKLCVHELATACTYQSR